MEVANINAETRGDIGSNKVAYLRGDGFIPAVLYGGKADPISLQINAQAMNACLRARQKVYNLSIGGQEQPSFLQEVQWDVLTDQPLHIDFLRIDMSKPIELDVELTFVGHPVGASKGGTMIRDRRVIRLSCKPEAIPSHVEVNIGPMDLGDKILAEDLELPEGVSLAIPGKTMICRIPA